MTLENSAAVFGFLAVVVNQIATQWRNERRHQFERAERKEIEEKASRERRRMARHMRNLRPDHHCAKRGCPLVEGPQPQPHPPGGLRAIA